METSKKPVEVRFSASAEKKMGLLEKTDKHHFEFVKRELRKFSDEYPDSVCAYIYPADKDGFRKFVADRARTITFSGIGQELPHKHILYIHDLFL